MPAGSTVCPVRAKPARTAAWRVGVSRSRACRRWPHKDLFFSDLALKLARNPGPGIFADEMDPIRRTATGRLDELADPQARRALVIELFRQLSVLDFETLYASPAWRTHLACTPRSSAWPTAGSAVRSVPRLPRPRRTNLARVARAWKLMAVC